MAATPPSGSITSPCPLSRNVCSLSLTSSSASRWRRNLSVRQSLASSTAPRPRLPWYCSSFDSKRLKRVKASAVEPAKPARILSLYSRRIFFAVCLMTDSPSVTWPSPARTTLPLRRIDKTVVERIRRFVDMSAILDYSSGKSPAIAPGPTRLRTSRRRSASTTKFGGSFSVLRAQFDSPKRIWGDVPPVALQLFKVKLLVSPVVPAFFTQVGAVVVPSVTVISTLIAEPSLNTASDPPPSPTILNSDSFQSVARSTTLSLPVVL